ncbi:hypothetical protein BGZ81_000524 [Podila clonocystis]|nr:hypothetical protein BGZ81_000524 [Podila clonocystis]
MLLIKSVLVLCSTAVVLAQRHVYSGADAVASAALFFGEDTTESLNPLDVFKNPINHATAASSVVALSAEQADFQPALKSADSLSQALDKFLTKVSTFPGLYLKSKSQRTVALKNYTTAEQFQTGIKDGHPQYPHIGKIALRFAELLPLDLGCEEAERLKNWILSLVVIDKPKGNNTVRVQLSHVALSIAYDKGSWACSDPTPTLGLYIPEQRASITFADYEINTGFLIAYAEHLVDLLPIVNVESTIALLTSPERNILEPEDRLFWGSQQRVFSF